MVHRDYELRILDNHCNIADFNLLEQTGSLLHEKNLRTKHPYSRLQMKESLPASLLHSLWLGLLPVSLQCSEMCLFSLHWAPKISTTSEKMWLCIALVTK